MHTEAEQDAEPVLGYEVKSRPVYPPVQKNSRAKYHLFVCQGDMPEAMASVVEACEAVGHRLIEASDPVTAVQQLQQVTPELPLATCAYVAGDEAFIWTVAEALGAAGMIPEQIQPFAPADRSRHVFCCHCYHITSGVTHTPAACAGCQRLLAVTDHFSRKLAAYRGIQINAEDPADIPEPMELK
ncbi:dimethylamine monooxygenase subunit DmmA family protein [Pseudomaricurvus sp. HS19]|uniref:dimethylamine monooxygenase subunit DmmA family protein n=1 Tax=Pseudomaricurvus sp. HS19 TaxID=2692626 RepID=UPI00136DD670|nr:dimethylamine monooxygenase subunit DmmA family protein [Pseudomaricurvus sp. HS19]MYM64945.1 hypothetical protein [Pseudomaricurvus sp. HS19]